MRQSFDMTAFQRKGKKAYGIKRPPPARAPCVTRIARAAKGMRPSGL